MAKVSLDPYIFFTGDCRMAMEFYKGVFGGELNITTLKEGGMGDSDSVMHAQLKSDDFDLMAADGTRTEAYPVCRVTLSLSGNDEAKLKKYFAELSDGGKVTAPLKTESWGDTFGTLTDKFGIDWMVNINSNRS